MAETAEKYLRKGSQVYIEGKIKTRSWDDQQGQKRYTTEVVADIMQLLDRPGNNSPSAGNSQSTEKQEMQSPSPADQTPTTETQNESSGSSSPFSSPNAPTGDASDLPF